MGVVVAAKDQTPGNCGSPIFDPSLKSSILPGFKAVRHFCIESPKQVFGSRMRLFIQPLLQYRPDLFVRIGTCAPRVRLGIGASLPIWSANLAVAPSGFEAPNEVIEFQNRWTRFGIGPRLEPSYFFLGLSKLTQECQRIQRGELFSKPLLHTRVYSFISKQLFARSGRRVILLDHSAAFPRFGLELERGLEEVDV